MLLAAFIVACACAACCWLIAERSVIKCSDIGNLDTQTAGAILDIGLTHCDFGFGVFPGGVC